MIGIYKITNQINGKCYIGQSVNIKQRWKEHRTRSKREDTLLYRAIRKYGLENFSFEVVEECNKEQLNEREIYWISYYQSNNIDNGYNLSKGGESGHPIKLTKENVQEIYSLLKTNMTMEDIADKFNVTHPVISNINTGKLWVNENIEYPIRKHLEKKRYYCKDCNKEISKYANRCQKCAAKYRQIQPQNKSNQIKQNNRKEIPITREELKHKIRTQSFLSIGKEFGVSDNAIRKWCDKYNLPKRKTDIKNYSDEEWELI